MTGQESQQQTQRFEMRHFDMSQPGGDDQEHGREQRFWAARFIDHLRTFIPGVLQRPAVIAALLQLGVGRLDIHALQNEAVSIANEWSQVYMHPNVPVPHELLAHTRDFKRTVLHLLKSTNLKCYPDLLEHMLEELEYFVKVIVPKRPSWSLARQIVFYSTEHKENLEFGGCIVPQLVLEDNRGDPTVDVPEAVQQGLHEGGELAEQFAALSRHIRTRKLNDAQARDAFQKLAHKHLGGLEQLIAGVPSLPINRDTKVLLTEMVKHERLEAIEAMRMLGIH